MSDIPHLKLALFGQSGAGKTTFFASYYGGQRTHGFGTKHGYRLSAPSLAQRNALLGRFHCMEDGKFPDPTDSVEVYEFDLFVGDLLTPGMRISWLDYPGGWWERRPADSAEQRDRLRALSELISSHAVILLLDGARFRDEGRSYLRSTLSAFEILIDDIKQDATRFGIDISGIPQTVLLAISKADLLGSSISAEKVAKQVLVDAPNEVRKIAEALGAKGAPAPFLTHVILLSSAYAPEGGTIDVGRTMSLNLIAPITLAAILSDAARKAGAGGWYGFLASLLDGLASLVWFVDKLDDFLPKNLQFITKILKVLPLQKIAEGGATALREAQQDALKRHDAMTATAATMFLELESARGSRAYYRTEG